MHPSWSVVAKTAAPSRARSPAREEEKTRKEKEATGKAAAQPTAPQQSAAGEEEGKRQGKEKRDAKGETGEVVVSMMKYNKGGRFVSTHEVGEYRKFKFNRKGMRCREQEPLYVQGKVVVRTVKEYEEFREWVGRNPYISNVPKEVKGGDSKEEGRYCQLKMHVWREKESDCPAVCLSVFVLERVTEGTRKELEAAEGGKDFKRPQEVLEACRSTANTSLFHTMDPLCWSVPLKEWSSGAATVTYREEAQGRKQGTGSRELVVYVDESNKKRLQELKVKRDAALKAKSAAQGSKKGFQKVGK